MNFRLIRIKSELNPEVDRLSYYASTGDNYRVAKSVNLNHWLAYYRSSRDGQFSLIGPPVPTKRAACELCEEHSLDLPW